MRTTSKTKSNFERLLSKIYARRFCKNNQQVCIDCLKPRSNKNNFHCKNCGCTKFYVFDYQNSSFVILSSLSCSKWQYCQKLNLILMQQIILNNFSFSINPSKNRKLNT